jgi:protein-disulfide isomerase
VSNERQQRAARAEQMRKERERAEKRQRNRITVGIIVVVLALVGAGAWAVNSASNSREPEKKVITPTGATKNFGVMYTPEDAGGKTRDDTVDVVLYEDFQCPGCKAFEQADGAFVSQAVKSGDISVEYRMVNFLDRSSPNKYSSRAGSAGLCAYASGGGKAFKSVHDVFYANQPQEGTAGPENPALVDTLKQSGVSGAAVESCVLKEKYIPWLDKATDASRTEKVSGTPTVRIAGKTVSGANNTIPQITDLQKAIAAAQKS